MTTADDIFDRSTNNFQHLGLSASPFTESPIPFDDVLGKVFTGREDELLQVFNLFQSRERRRILVYGHIGIGKSAFLLEVLATLRRKRPQMLTTYISLPANVDLATAALIAVAQKMPDDEWAQQQLYQMGIPTDVPLKERTTEINAQFGIGGKYGEKDLLTNRPQYPAISLDTLLERAQSYYPQGVVIAIDDLDKQDPSVVRKLMHDAQGMLKGRAWFVLTGHPNGMTGDLLTSERGLFDLRLKLEELDPSTTYKMLINYLNSTRPDNDCTDPDNPRSVLPFVPETAAQFCKISLGKPRLFNRLGSTVLSTAADLQASTITPEILRQGLKAAALTLREKAALTFTEVKVLTFLQEKGNLSEDITLNDLEQLGFTSYSELYPILEKLDRTDLAHQLNQDDAKVFEPIPLPPADEE